MRLASWSLHPVRVPYRVPVEWSDVAETAADLLVLRLRAEDGREGVAEGTAKPTWSGHTLRTLAAALEEVILPRLMGLELTPDALLRALSRVPENAAAKAMADAALRDVLDAPTTGDVALTWTVTLKGPAAMAADAEAAVRAHGFRHLKMKGGRSFTRDRETIAAIRAAVGPDMALTMDMNGLHEDGPALHAHLAALTDLTHVEDPTTLRPDAAFDAIRAASAVPVIVDAAIWSEPDAAAFLARGATLLGVKPGRVGPTVTERIAARGAEVGIGLFGEYDLGAPATWRLARRLGGTLPAETATFLFYDRPMTRDPPTVRDGRVTIPPGNAASRADWDAIARLHP